MKIAKKPQMTRDDSVVMPVSCDREDCGMISPYRIWKDGSYRKVFDACSHSKVIPKRVAVEEAWKRERL